MSACARSAARCHCCVRTNAPMYAAAFRSGRSGARRFKLKRDEIRMNRHRALSLLFEYELFGKPLRTFPDHALARAAIVRALLARLAQRAVDLAFHAETKRGADAQRARDGIFEIDAVLGREDLLQAETRRGKGAELRAPIGFELAPAAINLRAVA